MADRKALEPVYLEPFIHQVGGHSHMFSLDDTTVCKPLIARELSFYETMPDQMKPFVPEYRGVVEVKFVKDSDGSVTLMAYVPKTFRRAGQQTASSHCGQVRARRRVRLLSCGRIEVFDERRHVFQEAADSMTECQRALHNPWLLNCASQQLFSYNSHSDVSHVTAASPHSSCKYILLENLTHSYTYPCVLDLKMGTRQYADDDTDAKQRSKKAKVANTTSCTLGVRINGMQVYSSRLGRYLCRSKYYGRQLSVEGFKEALRYFVCGGDEGGDVTLSRGRCSVVARWIHRLHELRATLMHLVSFRFFTSSLLLIYDAATSTVSPLHLPATTSNTSPHFPITSSVTSDSPHPHTSTTSAFFYQHADTSSDVESPPVCSGGQVTSVTAASDSHERVDVRIIDFAHATHAGLEGSVAHHGPDRGFLFGVENLLQMLESVLQKLS